MLDNIDKKNPFSVPENYFQNFNSDLMSKLPDMDVEVRKPNVKPLWQTLSQWVTAAAMVAGLAFTGLHYMNDDAHNAVSDAKSVAMVAFVPNEISVENDYYLYLEDTATRMAYKDAFYTDDIF